MPRWSKRSLAAQAMGSVDPVTKAVVPPIHVATTYVRDDDNAYSSGYAYGRPDNATVRQAEAVIAMLEEAEAGALLFASGMAAATAVFQALDPGDHVVAPKVMYWALRDWLPTEAARWGLAVELVDTADLDALRARGPARPHQARLGRDAREPALDRHRHRRRGRDRARRRARASPSIRPCASPAHTRPLALGADLVMHAATKVLNGHSDVVAGALAAARADAFWERIVAHPRGPGRDPRSVRGLSADARHAHAPPCAPRLRRKPPWPSRSGWRAHPRVARVLYPGLPTHPRPRRSRRGRWRADSGRCCRSRLRTARPPRSRPAARVELWKRATSLGGVESLIEHRASVEGPGSPCPPDLLRLSVGIEDPDDLFDDLDAALRAARR